MKKTIAVLAAAGAMALTPSRLAAKSRKASVFSATTFFESD